jgi:hypothetical protein
LGRIAQEKHGRESTIFLCRRFNLNQASIEDRIRKTIYEKTSYAFCPPDSEWVNCRTPNFFRYSNECGPRIILFLAVVSSHPNPHNDILLPYLHSNLAQYSRAWMGLLLLTGKVFLLPTTDTMTNPINLYTPVNSIPRSLVPWSHPQLNATTDYTGHPTQTIQPSTDIIRNTGSLSYQDNEVESNAKSVHNSKHPF